MKKTLIVLCAALALTSCTAARRLPTAPSAHDLPSGFSLVQDAGNGYFLYQAPVGYFLVSRQRQGNSLGSMTKSNVFVDIIYIGKELK